MSHSDLWPALPLNEWQDTYRTLYMWTIVGKIRMTLSPPINHWWHVTLYLNSRGLTTGPVPYPPGVFEIPGLTGGSEKGDVELTASFALTGLQTEV